MSEGYGFPDPLNPGQFGLSDFDSVACYDSRWASNKEVSELVLAGKYELLTPLVSEFIPTLLCPFCCPTCHFRSVKEEAGVQPGQSAHDSRVEMTVDRAKEYLDKLADGGCQAILLTGGGEPTYHPHLREIVSHAKKRKFEISMSTNGTFAGGGFEPKDVVEYGFTKVRVSLDTTIDHDVFHGYDSSQVNWCKIVLKNIEQIIAAKKSTNIELDICIVFDVRNVEELAVLGAKIAEYKGINLVIIRPVIDYFGHKQVEERIIRRAEELVVSKFEPAVRQSDIRVIMPKYRQISTGGAQRKYSQCRACGLIGGVWSDGRMFICTETNGSDSFCIGDLSTQTLQEIYSSDQYLKLRANVSRHSFASCPVTCRPTKPNLIFDQIEQFRAHGDDQQLKRWVKALQAQHNKPNLWIQT